MAFGTNIQHVLLLALFQVSLFANAQWFEENGQGFLSAGCRNWNAYKMVLTATCPDQVCGNMVVSRLDLNECILNVNGNMYYNETGYFWESCRYPFIEGHSILTAHCRAEKQDEEKIGMVDLNNGIIINYYGYLSCFGKVDYGLSGTHNWFCKGDDWKPWSTSSSKPGIEGAFEPKPVVPRDNLVPTVEFNKRVAVAANATGSTNITFATVTVTATPGT